ncbi:hypothetical protein [Entomomonas asaccharolytica]|uniref:TubC N-terminal docking domain-containing protein n=1 Tax=Entomomonas asaccharolytica TaxID=2785331 RepID=A0A974RYC5_9GAMM|nr:hypothetical protein [Entomomonas asaccharolytica]QQP85744.1 hypothetical protein JHT90_00315 [Entomomonas asaccharolytica]
MTSINPIQYLTKQGLTISITDNKLNVKPSNRVTKEIANYIKQHKDIIKSELLAHSQPLEKISQLTELSPIQYNWLNQIAHILQVTPEYLLQHKLIDQSDLVELIDKPLVIVASTIKAGYYWIKQK